VAGEALFIGWGQVVRGREQKALDIFNESVTYWSGLKESGQIDDLDIVLLNPHGGDLAGFALLRGDPDKLDDARNSEEFQRMIFRANLVIEGLGVVGAVSGEALGEGMALYQQQLADLT